jgi:EmrB/QacA subfamily drug resistance transporter
VAAAGYDEPRALTPRRGRIGLSVATLCGLMFLTFLDNTVVTVALGNIQHTVHAGVAPLQWIVNGYALAFAALMLPAGAISDSLGRKKIMLGGTALFCAGSVVCALAGSYQTLIVGRVIMGVGAAASEPGTLSMLRQMFPDEPMRGRVVGLWAAVSGLALALGPVVGGALVGLGGWRLIFWFGLALGTVLLIAAMIVLPESSDPRAGRVDLLGAVLGIAALGALIDGVVRAEGLGYGNRHVVVLLSLSALAAIGFVLRQRYSSHPLLDLAGVDRKAFAVANIAAFTTYFATFAVFLFTALYLQQVSGYDGYRIAAQFLPLTAGMVIAALVAGRWSGRRGTSVPTAVGCAVFGVGLLATTAVIRPNPPELLLAAALGVVGIGIGLTVVPITNAALAAVPSSRSGMAASATNTSRELGAVVGVAVLGAVVSTHLTRDLTVSLHRLHVPSLFQGFIIRAVERNGTAGYEQIVAGHATIAQQVVIAAHSAFGDGLHIALITSATLVILTGVLVAATSRRSRDASPLESGRDRGVGRLRSRGLTGAGQDPAEVRGADAPGAG